jgi:hypothetical protein
MTIAILAAVAMFVQDVLGTLLTQAEARNKANLSAALDSVGWFAAIATTTLSVSTLQGHDLGDKIAVLALVSLANYVGTFAGTRIGQRFIPTEEPEPARVTLRAWNGTENSR